MALSDEEGPPSLILNSDDDDMDDDGAENDDEGLEEALAGVPPVLKVRSARTAKATLKNFLHWVENGGDGNNPLVSL